VEPGLDCHTVRLAGGDCLQAHAVVLATGGAPVNLKSRGDGFLRERGILLRRLRRFFFRNKTVTVIGGGDSAIEESLYLAKLAKQVFIVHRPGPAAAGRCSSSGPRPSARSSSGGTRWSPPIRADANGVCAVDLKNTRTGEPAELATDGCSSSSAFVPNNRLVPAGIKMNADGYVVTDDKCATSLPGIYVIGDLREKYARQIVLAAADGCTAALAAAHYVETRKASLECELPENLRDGLAH